MAQTVFARVEQKYLLSRGVAEALLQDMAPYIKPDAYFRQTICNVYYDTPHSDLIRLSLDKPIYKEKVRMRSYGVPGSGDKVFLELKKKYDGIVYKRRVSLPYEKALAFAQGERPAQLTQIQKELAYAFDRYQLAPNLFLAYDRESYKGREDPALRLTLDHNIRFRRDRMALGEGDDGTLLLPPDMRLMELKLLGGMPLWMVKLFEKHSIRKTSFSKYGRIYMQYQNLFPEKGTPPQGEALVPLHV